MHPGFKMNLVSAMRIAFALPMIDVLEELLRKIRPYELSAGSTEAAFEKAMDEVVYVCRSTDPRGEKRI